jgi:nicotinate-nucleotide adenylyltransferase
MRVAVFGGSFDPPHIGHVLACQYVIAMHPVDEVWMVPCFRHPFQKRTTDYAHRVRMCELAAATLGPRCKVSTIEEELGGAGYTLHLVRALRSRYPEHELSLVIGADLVPERERWFGAHELALLVPFIVLGRSLGRGASEGSGPKAASTFRDHRHAEAVDLPEVSSTRVRDALREGRSPSGWVPAAVLSYIETHRLYSNRETES